MIHYVTTRTTSAYPLKALATSLVCTGQLGRPCIWAVQSLARARAIWPHSRAIRQLSSTPNLEVSSRDARRYTGPKVPATFRTRPKTRIPGALGGSGIWRAGSNGYRNADSLQQRSLVSLARTAWWKSKHSPSESSWRRFKSSSTSSRKNGKGSDTKASQGNDAKSPATGTGPLWASNKQLLNRLPHVGYIHRPTREELLAAATGFWARQKVRFKWFSIRSLRPFNTDDISAFFSWFIVGHVIWIVLGTTTFFSLAILLVNTVFAQG